MPSLFKRMTSFEKKNSWSCVSLNASTCADTTELSEYEHLCKAQYEECTSFTNYLKKITVWPKQMLVIPSDIQVYACTTFSAFLEYMLMMSTLNYHTVRYETSSNMVAVIKIVMVVWKLMVWNGSEHNTSVLAWRNWWTWWDILK